MLTISMYLKTIKAHSKNNKQSTIKFVNLFLKHILTNLDINEDIANYQVESNRLSPIMNGKGSFPAYIISEICAPQRKGQLLNAFSKLQKLIFEDRHIINARQELLALVGADERCKEFISAYIKMDNATFFAETFLDALRAPNRPDSTDDSADIISDLINELFNMSDQLSKLVAKMESLQPKVQFAKASNNAFWEEIYGAEFHAHILHFTLLNEKIDEKRVQIERIKANLLSSSISYPAVANTIHSGHSTSEILCVADPLHCIQSDVRQISNWILAEDATLDHIAEKVEELIYDYLADSENKISLSDQLELLPRNRSTALALLELTASFDLYELYDKIFDDYTPYLSTDELSQAKRRAQSIFDQFLLKHWGISEE